MNGKELRRKVRLILSHFKPHEQIYRHTEKELFVERVRLAKNPDDEPVVDFNDTAVVNEKVILLKTLARQPGVSEAHFVRILVEETNDDNAPVVVHALIELGQLNAVLAMLKSDRKGRESSTRAANPVVTLKAHLFGPDLSFPGAIWEALGEKLRREPQRFTDADLDAIEEIRKAEETLLRAQQKRRINEATTI